MMTGDAVPQGSVTCSKKEGNTSFPDLFEVFFLQFFTQCFLAQNI